MFGKLVGFSCCIHFSFLYITLILDVFICIAHLHEKINLKILYWNCKLGLVLWFHQKLHLLILNSFKYVTWFIESIPDLLMLFNIFLTSWRSSTLLVIFSKWKCLSYKVLHFFFFFQLIILIWLFHDRTQCLIQFLWLVATYSATVVLAQLHLLLLLMGLRQHILKRNVLCAER